MKVKYHTLIFYGKGLFTIIAILWVFNISAQDTFMKTIGGVGDESINSVIKTTDNNYLIIGYSTSFGNGNADGFVAKINEQGAEIWSKTFGGALNDELYGVVQLANDEYVLCGWTQSFGAQQEDIWIMKISDEGEEIWTKTFGGNRDERAYSIINTSDNGILLTGWTKSFGAGLLDIMALKISSDGTTIWSKTLGRSGNEWCNFGGIIEDGNGHYLVTGAWTSNDGFPGHNGILFKLDTEGNMIEADIYGNSGDEGFNGSLCEINGAIVAVGGTWSFGVPDHKIWLKGFDEEQQNIWSRTISMPDENIRSGFSTVTSDNHLLISAYQFTLSTAGNGILVKTNPAGEIIWSKMYGQQGITQINAAVESGDGILVFGHTNGFGHGGKDILIMKTGSNGNVPDCSLDVDLQNNAVSSQFSSVVETVADFDQGVDQDVVSVNDVTFNEVFICNNSTGLNELNNPDSFGAYIFPNPNNGYFELTLDKELLKPLSYKLTNQLGAIISIGQEDELFTQNNIQFANIPTGMYFMELITEEKRIVKKIIVQ